MDVRIAEDSDSAAWDRYVFKHADGLAYHQFAWKKAVKDAYRFNALYLIAVLDGEVCGVLPLIEFRRPLSNPIYISLPYCDVGGCLADSPEIEEALLSKARDVIAEGRWELELRGRAQKNQTMNHSVGGVKVRMVLELPESSDKLLAGMKSKLRSQIRKPVRDGLTARLGGAGLVDEFYQIFSKNMRDIGSPVHSRKWIGSIVNHFAENARVGIVYTPQGVPAAAGLILLNRDIISIPWASSLRKYNRYNPNMLLYWTFLSFAADGGYRYFDFGRSTPGEGTYKFKEQWGARPEALHWVRLDMAGAEMDSSLSLSLARKKIEACWKLLPLSLCNGLGPILRRYISL